MSGLGDLPERMAARLSEGMSRARECDIDTDLMGTLRLLIALSCFALSACTAAPEEEGVERDIAVGVYSEFLDAGEVEAQLPMLRRQRVSVTLAVPASRIGDPELASLLRRAAGAGVALRLWPVLERDQGYWPNETNMELFTSEVSRLLGWLDDEGLVAEAVVYDLEPALEYSERIRVLDPMNRDEIIALMESHLDAGAFEEARALLAASVAEVQAAGLRAVCITFPQVLDDLVDGDDDLQDALDIPVRGVPFDEVGLMVYQTQFAQAAGEWIGPPLISAFAVDAAAHFGEAAVIALGKVGDAGIFEAEGEIYQSPEALAADVAAAGAEGIGRVEVYSLDGMVEGGDPEPWLDATITDPEPGGHSSSADLVRFFVQGLDSSLDR